MYSEDWEFFPNGSGRRNSKLMAVAEHNKTEFEEVMMRLNEALEKKKKEISEFEAKYEIRTNDEVEESKARLPPHKESPCWSVSASER